MSDNKTSNSNNSNSLSADAAAYKPALGATNIGGSVDAAPPVLPADATPATATAPAAVTATAAAPPPVAAADTAAADTTTVEKASVDAVVDQFENMTVFGGKNMKELEEIQAKTSHLNAGILFDDPSLNIPQPIVESLVQEMRFKKPSAIQAATLPIIFSGQNLIAQAQSGAGKTIAFTIGMLRCVDVNQPTLQALCLSPTRELANQIVSDALVPLSTRMGPQLKYECAVPREDRVTGPSDAQIVVGTCGTVLNWIAAKRINMNTVKLFVLDEADKMIEKKEKSLEPLNIHKKLPKGVQVLLFSATYNDKILAFAGKIAPQAAVIRPPDPDDLVLDVILQVRMNVSMVPGGKLQVLKDIYDFMTVQQGIVFVETIENCNAVAKMMQDAGLAVSVLHSDLKGEMRDKVFGDFKDGRSKVLIATNALARGVDVPAVAVVVNYDLPAIRFGGPGKVRADEATYLHRIGRCGRFGRKGTAISFLATQEDFDILESIERYYSPLKPMTIEWDANDVEGLALKVDATPTGGEILPQAVTTSQ